MLNMKGDFAWVFMGDRNIVLLHRVARAKNDEKNSAAR